MLRASVLPPPEKEGWYKKCNASLQRMGDELLVMGAKTVVIKCGAAGMYYCSAGESGFVPSYPVTRYVSATGAGDTSIAAFLAGRLRGLALKKCVQLACAAGAACVSAYDALSGLKPFETLLSETSEIVPAR
jgi:sugar/nucleoside kinase (ribokinase family)